MVFRLYTPGQVKSFIFIRLPFASWFSICIKHSNQRLYRSTLGVDRRSSCRDISSRNPKGYLLPFYSQPWVQILEKPRSELVLCAEKEREKKRSNRCLEAVASLSTTVRCAILAPRVVGAGKTDGWKRRGRAENDDVQKTNRSWRIPDSARFSNAPEKLPVRRETFLAAGCHIGTQASGYREWIHLE